MSNKDIHSASVEITAGIAGPHQVKTIDVPEGEPGGPVALPDEPLTRRQKFRLLGLVILKVRPLHRHPSSSGKKDGDEAEGRISRLPGPIAGISSGGSTARPAGQPARQVLPPARQLS